MTRVVEGWILGRFRFWLHGQACGDWDDEADLHSCHYWLKTFVEEDTHRTEPDLLALSAEEVWEEIVSPVYDRGQDSCEQTERYGNVYSRFHISHIGMSSFDRIVMVLVESAGAQRCVWKDLRTKAICDNVFPARHMQCVAREFCRLMEERIPNISTARS